jgi:hypothetical protein
MMNSFHLPYEIDYRRERLEQESMRRRSQHSTRRQRWSWFARRSTRTAEAGALPTPVTTTVPAVGTAEFHDWATEVCSEFAERGVIAVKRQLEALAQLAQHHGVAAVARSVLVDRREHEVARARALLRVVTALEQLTPVTIDTTGVAA